MGKSTNMRVRVMVFAGGQVAYGDVVDPMCLRPRQLAYMYAGTWPSCERTHMKREQTGRLAGEIWVPMCASLPEWLPKPS